MSRDYKLTPPTKTQAYQIQLLQARSASELEAATRLCEDLYDAYVKLHEQYALLSPDEVYVFALFQLEDARATEARNSSGVDEYFAAKKNFRELVAANSFIVANILGEALPVFSLDTISLLNHVYLGKADK